MCWLCMGLNLIIFLPLLVLWMKRSMEIIFIITIILITGSYTKYSLSLSTTPTPQASLGACGELGVYRRGWGRHMSDVWTKSLQHWIMQSPSSRQLGSGVHYLNYCECLGRKNSSTARRAGAGCRPAASPAVYYFFTEQKLLIFLHSALATL